VRIMCELRAHARPRARTASFSRSDGPTSLDRSLVEIEIDTALFRIGAAVFGHSSHNDLSPFLLQIGSASLVLGAGR